MPSIKDIAWLAGIVEGEGCITKDLGLHIAMTDKDVMDKVASLIGKPHYLGRRNSNWPKHYKDVYKLQVHGPLAAGWLQTLYPLLGERRRETIRIALIKWKSHPVRKAANTFRPSPCHPERMYFAKGLCKVCYAGEQYYVHRQIIKPRKETYK